MNRGTKRRSRVLIAVSRLVWIVPPLIPSAIAVLDVQQRVQARLDRLMDIAVVEFQLLIDVHQNRRADWVTSSSRVDLFCCFLRDGPFR